MSSQRISDTAMWRGPPGPRGASPRALPEQAEEGPKRRSSSRRESSPAPRIGRFPEHLALRGIGMHRGADLPESDAGGHRQHDFADHVAGALAHEGRTDDPVGAPPQVNPKEALVLPVEHGAIDLAQRDSDGVD